MKQIFLIVTLFLSSMTIYAQRIVLDYMGIPIDGTKSEMIRKLEAKGGKYNALFDWVEINNSYVSIGTYNNKVWRLVINHSFLPMSEDEAKAVYNKACKTMNEILYYPIKEVCPISDEENISYEMKVHNKQYSIAGFSIPWDYLELFWNNRNKLTPEQQNNIIMRRCWTVLQLDTTFGGAPHYNVISYLENMYNAPADYK